MLEQYYSNNIVKLRDVLDESKSVHQQIKKDSLFKKNDGLEQVEIAHPSRDFEFIWIESDRYEL